MSRGRYLPLRRAVQKERAEAISRSKRKSAVEYRAGFQAGYRLGVEEGQRTFAIPFEGTSIVIPTYNQKELLLQCIDSIEAHTEQPYEIIVVDDGSSDGTTEALQRRRGAIRVGSHRKNLGFASAVNTGLMMAKGQKIVLLNNDVIVSERWLKQMLAVLESNPNAAIGPVTNYIGGEQQIDTDYVSRSEMESFAANYNVADRSKWRETDRLVGFCVLFRRELFEEVGYFDEGFEIGNFEDDDWMLRLRLQGKHLIIAGDTFVHHIGSVTMKGLGEDRYLVVNHRNESLFHEKWGKPFELLQRLNTQKGRLCHRKSSDFFPTHVWVEGAGRLFWLEHGVKYPFIDVPSGNMPNKPTRLSVIDLVQIPTGTRYSRGKSAYQEKGFVREGAVVRCGNGYLYQVDQGRLREIASDYACGQWGLSIEPDPISPEELRKFEEGVPILPPPRLKSEDL
ncbi:glycosyltransferase family 2 protein [Paenibacillus woosongensis]|uniref:Glycosyltransferase family 2 protein n=1 Tax=Paenibacillus woosongensis TaxID=307580 RepID=A0AA95L2F0_9BACL|nr:glycosyltransferase family 2 protein [Paenibacillus woosongensis]WHX50366.1 glycosyltransferase family 2 protein [Paenibacillus woosongensis]